MIRRQVSFDVKSRLAGDRIADKRTGMRGTTQVVKIHNAHEARRCIDTTNERKIFRTRGMMERQDEIERKSRQIERYSGDIGASCVSITQSLCALLAGYNRKVCNRAPSRDKRKFKLRIEAEKKDERKRKYKIRNGRQPANHCSPPRAPWNDVAEGSYIVVARISPGC